MEGREGEGRGGGGRGGGTCSKVLGGIDAPGNIEPPSQTTVPNNTCDMTCIQPH